MTHRYVLRVGRVLLAMVGGLGVTHSLAAIPSKVPKYLESKTSSEIEFRVERAREKLIYELGLDESDLENPEVVAQWYNWPNWNNWFDQWRNW